MVVLQEPTHLILRIHKTNIVNYLQIFLSLEVVMVSLASFFITYFFCYLSTVFIMVVILCEFVGGKLRPI